MALEYAAGGELFDTVARAGKLPEIEARYFFQQLILGLEYCHNRVGGTLARWVCNRVLSVPCRPSIHLLHPLRQPACSAAALRQTSAAGVSSRGWCTGT